jgi:short-subunit dehydrogenase
VSLTESLYHDLKLVQAKIGASVLCPAYVPTGIAQSHRNRPDALRDNAPATASQRAAQAAISKAVDSGRMSAADVARSTFEAIEAERFYVFTHPQIMPTVELRFADVLQGRNPSDPFSTKPQLKPQLKT